ncbi:MAG: M20/M25/M40 family metallo-hydrolase [Oligoflexales bacterium]|nr:M20/M25/M40 family metallo-hydrolase [Oligoflexales bacterium]
MNIVVLLIIPILVHCGKNEKTSQPETKGGFPSDWVGTEDWAGGAWLISTQSWESAGQSSLGLSSKIPVNPVFKERVPLTKVKELFALSDKSRIQENIEKLVALGTRGHTTEQGIATPAFIIQLIQDAVGSDLPSLAYKKVPLSNKLSQQNNLVVSLPGTVDDKTVIVLGAHMDTIIGSNPSLPASGADDNGSGVSSLIEVLSVLANVQATFQRRVELHFYAAEEIGLVGSFDLVGQYRAAKINVGAMMNFDMNSFSHIANDQKIYLLTTNTSPELTLSTKNLLISYLGGNLEELPLPEGSSDHQAWFQGGYASVFPFEHPTLYNQVLHTPKDTIATAHNFALSERFVHLALTFLSHYAGLVSATDEYDSLVTDSTLLAPQIFLAVTPASTDGGWDITSAVGSQIKKVIVCESASSAVSLCASALNNFESRSGVNGSSFFVNNASSQFSLVDGSSLVFFAYNSKDELVQRRSVKLTKK